MKFISYIIIPSLLASLITIATRTPKSKEGDKISSLPPSLVIRKPLLNIDPSILKIVGDSILTTLVSQVVATASLSEPTKLAQLAAITPTPVITDPSQALVPILAKREIRSPEDKVIS